jgi:signal transduction histidine kinase
MASIATRLRLPAQVQDTLLAVFVAWFQIEGTHLVQVDQQARPLTQPAYLGYLLLIVSGLVLLVRRRWPVAVFATVVAVSLVYYAAGYPDGPGWLGLFVATYTLTAAHGDGHRSLKVVAAGIAVLTVGWLLTADLRPLNAAGWVFFRIGTLVMAAAVGEVVRMARVLAAQAQEWAERAEQTREQEARRRVDAERLRIAREVHDTVAHAIAVINVHAGVTAHVLDKRPEQARETLVTIEQTSARALDELRATLGVLRDAADDDRRSPSPGLDQVGELVGLAREAGLDVKAQVDAAPQELPSAVDQAAYRIVQESITNVIRHAGPARVTISLTYGPSDLEILVADDGRGARDAGHGQDGGGGRGIAGMRERVGLLGGELSAGARPGGGFQVRARLPLRLDQAVHS